MLKIERVETGTLGEELGLEAGDQLLGFDEHPASDLLDYLYYNEQESFTMTVQTRKGEVVDFEVEKETDEDLGLTFSEGELEPRTCRNKCVFCFVDQLPKGLRPTLYVKDDDYRLSLVSGNYVTLTNLSWDDEERIVRCHFSPLYLSVHAWDPELRRRMMNNRFAGRLEEQIRRFAGAGILMHAQIVLCPGWNDGEALTDTLSHLYEFYPRVATVAVVPVGLTGHREGLTPLSGVDRAKAAEVLEQCRDFNRSHPSEREPFALCSDEFYCIAGEDPPPAEWYGPCSQIENGVGLLSLFERDFSEALEKVRGRRLERHLAVPTGVSAYPFLQKWVSRLTEAAEGLKIDLFPVVNRFFGPSVTVTGLLTGGDIAAQCVSDAPALMIPDCMLREFQEVFLDDMSVRELGEKLNKRVLVHGGGGGDFVECALGDWNE